MRRLTCSKTEKNIHGTVEATILTFYVDKNLKTLNERLPKIPLLKFYGISLYSYNFL